MGNRKNLGNKIGEHRSRTDLHVSGEGHARHQSETWWGVMQHQLIDGDISTIVECTWPVRQRRTTLLRGRFGAETVRTNCAYRTTSASILQGRQGIKLDLNLVARPDIAAVDTGNISFHRKSCIKRDKFNQRIIAGNN